MGYHCGICLCPEEVWSKTLTTYNGVECRLYESFLSLIEDGITSEELIKVTIEKLPKEFSDIEDIDATVKELVKIVIDCGVLANESRDVVVASLSSSVAGPLRR